MKIRTLLTASLGILLFVSGCNTDDDEKVTQDNTVEEENNQGDSNQSGESTFNFTQFDLDVDYSGNQEFDVDYETERDELEAEIKDDTSNDHLNGDEAYSVLQPIFEQLTFDQDTSNEEVISEVLNAFELDEDFQKFELEVEFQDGTEKEYNSPQ